MRDRHGRVGLSELVYAVCPFSRADVLQAGPYQGQIANMESMQQKSLRRDYPNVPSVTTSASEYGGHVDRQRKRQLFSPITLGYVQQLRCSSFRFNGKCQSETNVGQQPQRRESQMSDKARQAAHGLLKENFEDTDLDTLNDEQICDVFNRAFFSDGDVFENAWEENIILMLDFSCYIYLTEHIPPATSPLINAGEAMPDFLTPLREIPEEYRWIISGNESAI